MEYTFQGYYRPDGKVGSRNYVAVIPTVICATDVAQAICHAVVGTVGFFHHQGCCQLPMDLKRVTDTLIALGSSPNVGAALIVSLGCEGTDVERVIREIGATGKPVEVVRIQEMGGMSRAVQVGADLAQKLAMEISGLQRQTADISRVVMGIKCGGSDTTSGMASNCVIGYVADKLVDLGATVVFGETTEFLGGEHILARRAVGGEDGPGAFDPGVRYRGSLQNYLIDTGDEVILVDTGLPAGTPRPPARTCAAASPPPATSRAACPASRRRAWAPS